MAVALQLNDASVDVILLCADGTSIEAHSELLMSCAYFAAKLRVEALERTDKSAKVTIKVPNEVDGDDLDIFLRTLYGNAQFDDGDFNRYIEMAEIFGAAPPEDGDDSQHSDDESSVDDDASFEVAVAAMPTVMPKTPIADAENSNDISKILLLKELLAELKPSNIQSTIERLPRFESGVASVIGDLVLFEFFRSRNIQSRKAHLDLYKRLHDEKRPLFDGDAVDFRTMLVCKVEFNFRQHVIDRSEDHYPPIAKNGVILNGLDEHVSDLRQQMRVDVRHHARAIVCLFGEFFKIGWVAYRSVDLAIAALLANGTSEKFEYFCHLLYLVEAEMLKQQPDGLAKYDEQIKLVLNGVNPNSRQMYLERHKKLDYKLMPQKYGIDDTAKTEVNSSILDQLYWMRQNVASLNTEQYYRQSGGMAVHGLESPVVQVKPEDLTPVAGPSQEPTVKTTPNTNGRVIRVPRVEFFKNLRIMQEKKLSDAQRTNNNNVTKSSKTNASAVTSTQTNSTENRAQNGGAPSQEPPNRPSRKQRDRARMVAFQQMRAAQSTYASASKPGPTASKTSKGKADENRAPHDNGQVQKPPNCPGKKKRVRTRLAANLYHDN